MAQTEGLGRQDELQQPEHDCRISDDHAGGKLVAGRKYLTADERPRFIAAAAHVSKPDDQTSCLRSPIPAPGSARSWRSRHSPAPQWHGVGELVSQAHGA